MIEISSQKEKKTFSLNYAIAKHQAYKNPTMLRDKACML
jgi:hypothetical protein